jgi:hypothetical protein
MHSNCRTSLRAALAAAVLIATGSADATPIDLISAGEGTSAGAIYRWLDASTVTASTQTFVQVSTTGNRDRSQAYNTTVNGVLDNGAPDNFNRTVTVADVPRIRIGNLLYREFLLDIHEDNGRGRQYLSLDEVQVFLGGTANAGVTTFDAGGLLQHDGTLIHDLEGGAGQWVALNHARNSGRGAGDLYLYLLDSLFAGFAGDAAVTLYSHFGRQGIDPAGFTGNFGASASAERAHRRRSSAPDDPLCTPYRPHRAGASVRRPRAGVSRVAGGGRGPAVPTARLIGSAATTRRSAPAHASARSAPSSRPRRGWFRCPVTSRTACSPRG